MCYYKAYFFKNLTAVKETLARELDRKRASPTESAVMREMVKGTLRSWYAEPMQYRSRRHIRPAHVMCQERGDIAFYLNAGGTAGIWFMTQIPSRNT